MPGADSTPLAVSTARQPLALMAAATFSGVRPPASASGIDEGHVGRRPGRDGQADPAAGRGERVVGRRFFIYAHGADHGEPGQRRA